MGSCTQTRWETPRGFPAKPPSCCTSVTAEDLGWTVSLHSRVISNACLTRSVDVLMQIRNQQTETRVFTRHCFRAFVSGSCLCRECVGQRCRVLRLKNQLNEDYKEVSNLVKRAARWVHSWLSWALCLKSAGLLSGLRCSSDHWPVFDVCQWRKLLGGKSISAELEAAGAGPAGGGGAGYQTQQHPDQWAGTTYQQQRSDFCLFFSV